MVGLLDDPRIDWKLLDRYGFDRQRFLADAARVVSGELTEASAIIRDPIEPAPAVTELRLDASSAAVQAKETGERALRAGQVAVVVLNGGMATRFGNVVKGVVEVYDGKSFLALKAEDVRRAAKTFGAPVPLVLMNSFATSEATQQDLEQQHRYGLPAADLLSFDQTISLRLDPKGGLFIHAGQPSTYAPGHGDFFGCIRRSGVLKKLLDRGIEVVLFSNVDNLGATVDPTVIGYHLLSNQAMSAEVTAKRRTASGAWDKGGAPAKVRGQVQLVEGFRFPSTLAEDFLPDFSTNNFLFSARAIDREIPLPRWLVKKKVDDQPALQLESITCEATAALDAQQQPVLSLNLLRVPREGEHGRFFPVKERADLEAMRGPLKERLEAGWRLR